MKIVNAFGALLFAFALLAIQPALAQGAEAETVADPDAKCVKCHSRGLKKKLEDGETLSLKVEVDEFATSVHQVIGCTGCHRDVAKGKHPSRAPIASHHDYSLKQNETCRQCHGAKYEAYEGSVHASLVAAGSQDAPMCSDCHDPHTIQPDSVYHRENGEPCSSCHADIYQAYEESVHGTARNRGNTIRAAHVEAPICADCHQAHEVSAVASIGFLVDTCMSCHEVARLAHEQWLPNAPMHMKSVGCAACHSPEADLRVDLQLYDNVTDAAVAPGAMHDALRKELAEIGTEGDSLDALDLWKLVRLTKVDGDDIDIILRGRLEAATGMDAHRLADSSKATRSCESCHESNSKAFSNVTVSITRPDGRRERFGADADVLSSVISVDSISGFYAPGGTRIKLLDYLLILAVLGGLAVPVVHISLGKMVRRSRKKALRKAAEQNASGAEQ